MIFTRRRFIQAVTAAGVSSAVPPSAAGGMYRRDYLDHFRYWFALIDRGWDERKGLYVPEDVGSAVDFNASMLPCLAVMGLEGDSRLARRIPRIIEHLMATPPWDPEYHYWNARFDRLGMEPHAGMFGVGLYLAMVYLHHKALGVPPDLLETAMDRVQLLTAKMAEAARRAGDIPFNCYVDAKGNVVDLGAIHREAVRQGVPADVRWLREAGPSNQLVELAVAAMAYLATRREAFWDHVRQIWGRIIEREENGRPLLFRSAIDPDYSYIYANDPKGGIHTHRYTQSVYATAFLFLHADAVRIARKLKRTDPLWEQVIRNYSQAAFGRILLLDGTCNMVCNAYGWERSVTANYFRAFYLARLVPLADLTPFTAGQLASMVEKSLRTLRALNEKDRLANFPPVLGLLGFSRAGSQYTARVVASELAEMILTNQEAMEVEEEPKPFPRCYSGFAWAQKHFVMQTPSYSLTIVGAGTPYLENRGYLGHGMTTSGGEYVLKIPDGPYLTPLSGFATALISARANGEDISSRDLNFFNSNTYGLRMEVILPDGTRISRGEDFAAPPYDPTLEKLAVEVSFGKGPVRLARRFDLSPEAATITDSIEALEDVEVAHCFSRVPMITAGPQGETLIWKGVAAGRPVEIKPPCHMGYADDLQQYDQDFIQSIRDLERLEVADPSGYGFHLERLEKGPVRLVISRGEWQENRRMRVDGKNLDYYWIGQPARLKKGEKRSFSYRITPGRV